MVLAGGVFFAWRFISGCPGVAHLSSARYAIERVEHVRGPVTGNQLIRIYGTGYSSTSGMVNVNFASGKHSAQAQGTVIDDDVIECKTPSVVGSIGPKRSVVTLAIGVRDFTTTSTHFDFYLNTIAEKSMCYGPGVLEESSRRALKALASF